MKGEITRSTEGRRGRGADEARNARTKGGVGEWVDGLASSPLAVSGELQGEMEGGSTATGPSGSGGVIGAKSERRLGRSFPFYACTERRQSPRPGDAGTLLGEGEVFVKGGRLAAKTEGGANSMSPPLLFLPGGAPCSIAHTPPSVESSVREIKPDTAEETATVILPTQRSIHVP